MDNKGALLPCSPFMDGNLICARGRMRHSPMPEATNYPIILHAKEPSIQLMIKNAHHKCMHLGTEFVRQYLQPSFIILGLRKALRYIRHHCFLCHHFQWKSLKPFMAVYLHSTSMTRKLIHIHSRTLDSTTSVHSTLLKKKPQKKTTFVSLLSTTRAIHLETTDILTTKICFTAIRRFMARRGSL